MNVENKIKRKDVKNSYPFLPPDKTAYKICHQLLSALNPESKATTNFFAFLRTTLWFTPVRIYNCDSCDFVRHDGRGCAQQTREVGFVLTFELCNNLNTRRPAEPLLQVHVDLT